MACKIYSQKPILKYYLWNWRTKCDKLAIYNYIYKILTFTTSNLNIISILEIISFCLIQFYNYILVVVTVVYIFLYIPHILMS